jgi:hypothetical protein
MGVRRRGGGGFPPVQCTELGNGQLFCRSAGTMVVPTSPHVRQIEFRLPRLAANPIINATVFPTNSEGPMFGIYAVKVNQIGSETQVAISAQYVGGGTGVGRLSDRELSKYDVRCHLMVTGKGEAGAGRRRNAGRKKS